MRLGRNLEIMDSNPLDFHMWTVRLRDKASYARVHRYISAELRVVFRLLEPGSVFLPLYCKKKWDYFLVRF